MFFISKYYFNYLKNVTSYSKDMLKEHVTEWAFQIPLKEIE